MVTKRYNLYENDTDFSDFDADFDDFDTEIDTHNNILFKDKLRKCRELKNKAYRM